MEQGDHKAGKKHGPWVSYFADGTVRREGTYDLGKKVGRWVLYHKNGNIQSESTFVEGVYSGHYCSYHENGQKFREGLYSEYVGGKSTDGRKEGVWIQYAPDGDVQHQNTYRRGAKVKEKPKGLRQQKK